MAKTGCNFPTSLDTLTTDRQTGQAVPSEAFDIIESILAALEAKVGVNSSAITSSHDYKIAALASASHTQGTDTTLGAMTNDINMNSHKITGLAAPAATNDAIRQTITITEAALGDAITKKHEQNKDQYLDQGGANQVAVADAKDAVDKKHTQGTDTTLGAITANIDMNSHKIINVTDPTLAQDAATKNYVDTHGIALDQVVLGSQIFG